MFAYYMDYRYMRSTYEDIWYAAKSTKIVFMPPKRLETFGETSVKYLVTAEDLDNPGKIHIREGLVTAERPRVITPHYFQQHAVENFGEDARRYFNEVMSREANARFIQYGLTFRKDEYQQQTVSGNLEEIAEQAAKDAQDHLDELRGVIIGKDDSWEVSLLYFVTQLVYRSLPYNARDIARRGLFAEQDGIPLAVSADLEEEMAHCTNREDARRLGAKLRDYGLFEHYEDRFYELFRKLS